MAGPHQGQPVLSAGESLERARAAMILVHGRGASAADIMTVAGEVIYPGSFDGTPAFLGCSDVDPHIRKDRVIEAAEVFERLGAQVTVRLYPNMAHTVNEDEIEEVRKIVKAVAG